MQNGIKVKKQIEDLAIKNQQRESCSHIFQTFTSSVVSRGSTDRPHGPHWTSNKIRLFLEQGRHPAFEIFALILIFLSNLAVLLGLILFKVCEIRFLCLFQTEKFFDFKKSRRKDLEESLSVEIHSSI